MSRVGEKWWGGADLGQGPGRFAATAHSLAFIAWRTRRTLLAPARPRITASRARLFRAALRAAFSPPIAPASGCRRPRPPPPAADPGAGRAPRAAAPPAEAIESFAATNIDELSGFDGERLKPGFRRLLEKYHGRVNAIEPDESTPIGVPPDWDRCARAPPSEDFGGLGGVEIERHRCADVIA